MVTTEDYPKQFRIYMAENFSYFVGINTNEFLEICTKFRFREPDVVDCKEPLRTFRLYGEVKCNVKNIKNVVEIAAHNKCNVSDYEAKHITFYEAVDKRTSKGCKNMINAICSIIFCLVIFVILK